MKIFFLMLYGDIGGAELVAFQHALIAKKNNQDITVLCPSKGVNYERMLTAGINTVHCPELETAQAMAHLEKYLKNADVVYNCNYFAINKYIPGLKKKYTFKYLHIVHSNIDWVFSQLKPFDNIIDGYFATHDLIKDELINHNFPEHKITLIPNSIDVSEIVATDEKVKKELKKVLGIPDDHLVIGMTTRFNFDKNIKDTVRLIDSVNKRIPVSIVIIGDATYPAGFKYKDDFLKLISKSPFKDRFHLLGKLPTSKDVYHWQRIYDIGINLSPSEGTPMTLFEQMAAGIYCIYPSVGGIPDVLTGYGSVMPVKQRLTLEEINKYPCYSDEEIECYSTEIFKYSRAYLSETGLKARDYILKNRNIELFEKDVLNFLTGKSRIVSVLMTCYNSNTAYLKQAIDSIINQTYADFEFVIINDCSTRYETISLLKEYSLQEKRIKLFSTPQNSGPGAAANFGLTKCFGDLIIRMDHDDIAHADLVKNQIRYFEQNHAAVVCGVQAKFFGAVNTITNHPEIVTKDYALRNTNFWFLNNPGVAFIKSVVQNVGGYYDGREIGEDYNLWCKLLQAGYVLNNQKETLIDYRCFPESYSRKYTRTKASQDFLIKSKELLLKNKYTDKVTYHMATMPDRIDLLKESVASILPQCDELHIYLNNFKVVPAFLNNTKIISYLSSEHMADLGDVGKFYNCETWTGYNFTVDDKIVYPINYTEKTITKIEQYKRKAIVTYHGRILHVERPCRSYYKDYKSIVDYLRNSPKDMQVHIPGTGVMALHSDNIMLTMDMFTHTNMSDIFIGIMAHNKKIDVIALQHPSAWMKVSRKFNTARSICNTFANNDKIQTQIINSIKLKAL